MYLTFIQCKCKLGKHVQSVIGENYEQHFPNKKNKQSNTRLVAVVRPMDALPLPTALDHLPAATAHTNTRL